MVSELARGDWEDLRAQGLDPTLDDFDRLNQIALRLADGAETTAANFPRVGWAGDVPFYEPTFQAFAWYHRFAARAAADEETAGTLWAFALAHAREPRFFEGLTEPDAIDRAVSAWASSLPATRDEVARACRWAACGLDDAHPADAGDARSVAEAQAAAPRFRADRTEAAKNLSALEARLAEACAALHAAPSDLECETPSRLDRIREAAAVELGRPLGRNEARLHADYDLTLREIRRRLKRGRDAATPPSTEAGRPPSPGDRCRGEGR